MSMIEGLAEGLTLAEKSGAGVENYVNFVETLFPGPMAAYAKRMYSGEASTRLHLEMKSTDSRTGDYHSREEPLFAVDLARKDARHMLALANEFGAKMGNVENIDKHFQIVQKEMGSRGDIAGAYGGARVDAGLPFKNS